MQTSLSDRTLTVYSDVSHVNLCAVTPLCTLGSVIATSGFFVMKLRLWVSSGVAVAAHCCM